MTILQKSDCCEWFFCTSGKNRYLRNSRCPKPPFVPPLSCRRYPPAWRGVIRAHPWSKNTRKSIIAAGFARAADGCRRQDKGVERMAKVEPSDAAQYRSLPAFRSKSPGAVFPHSFNTFQ